ncbi:MAG TPA: I78 family peptidase inhibitor [Candidatus Binatia bacterium]|nr:I78 family peptidase inhibitor [Candidatus Binatia bacterium]
MIRASLFALSLLAAACAPPASDPPAEQPPAEAPGPQTREEATAQDTCGAGAYRDRIGTNVSGMDVQPGARVVGPDTMVTEDFRPDRLNILVDAQGVITGFACY